MKMAAYRRIVVETPFPLMGKAGKGVLGNRTEHPLPLSFPVKGKDQDAVAGRFLYNSATSTALNQIFEGEHEAHEALMVQSSR